MGFVRVQHIPLGDFEPIMDTITMLEKKLTSLALEAFGSSGRKNERVHALFVFKPNLYALSKKTKSRIPPSIIHIFYQLKVRFKLDSMHLTIWKFLWPQITPRSELLGLKSYCALKICSLLVKKCPFLVPKIDFYKNSQKFLRW